MEFSLILPLLAVCLADPLPPLSDRDRFPPKESARSAMQFNRAYRLHAQTRQSFELHRWWEWQETLSETDRLFHCWDWLHAAQGGEGREEAYWRTSLVRLRQLIGDEAYMAGTMPPPAPVWRFEMVGGYR